MAREAILYPLLCKLHVLQPMNLGPINKGKARDRGRLDDALKYCAKSAIFSITFIVLDIKHLYGDNTAS